MLSSFLSTELLSLSNECKKQKEPILKDACEEMMATLREIKEDEGDLGLEIRKREGGIKVFLMALESKNYRIVVIAVGCIQKLIVYQAVPPSSLSLILNHFKTEIFSTIELQLKVLQILLPLCTLYEDVVHGELLAQALDICYKYSIVKNQPILSNTASATLRQMILHTFERLNVLADHSELAAKFEMDAFGLFQDLAFQIGSEPQSCTFLKLSQISIKTCLELVEVVVMSTPKLFVKYPGLLSNLRDKIGPTLAKLISGAGEFGVLVRAVRLIKVVIKHLTQLIPVQAELFITLFIKVIQSPSPTRILVLEVLKSLFADATIPLLIFQNFDSSDDFTNVYLLLTTSLTNLITELTPTLGDEPLSSSSAIKIAIIDQLDKDEFPPHPQSYLIHLATSVLLLMIDSEYKSILPMVQSDQPQETILMNCELARTGVEEITRALGMLAVCNLDDEMFEKVIKGLTRVGSVLGLMGLVGYRDTLFNLMTKLVLGGISDRSLVVLEGVLEMTNLLGDLVDAKMWFGVFETWVGLDNALRQKPEEKSRRLTNAAQLDKIVSPVAATFLEAYGSKFGNESALAATFSAIVKKQIDATQSMNQKSFIEFTRALCRLAHESITKDKDDKGFGLNKLNEVAQGNVKRLVDNDGIVFELLCNQLINIAHSPSCSPASRTLACTSFGELIVVASQMEEFGIERIESRLLDGVRALMAIEPRERDEVLVPEQPNNDLSRLPYLNEVRRQGLEIINKLLQRSGQNIRSGWLAILEIIYFVVQSQIKKPGLLKNDSSMLETASVVSSTSHAPLELRVTIQSSNVAGLDTPTTNNAKLLNLLRIGFPSIELICTDFMSSLTPTALSRCIQTVAAFGSLSDDLNISLTSVSLLWTLCDYILTKREALDKEKNEMGNDDESINKGSLLDLTMLNGPLSLVTMDTLWMYLLRNLSELCSDLRPEVRNSANQTLFRTISMNGSRLNIDSWELLLSHVLFPLLDRIQTSAPKEHDKNWDETKIVTLNGVTKSLTEFLHVLVELEDRFEWITFLNYLKSTCLQSSQEVAIAALKNFKALISYGLKNEIPHNVADKIAKLWQVALHVWCEIGDEIVQNAEQNYILAADALPHTIVQWSNETTPFLLVGNFTQDALTIYFSIISDMYPLVKTVFSFSLFQKVTRNFQILLLYHSKPVFGATATRIRVDNVNDLDQMTNCQTSFADWLSNKLDFPFQHEAKSLIVNVLSDNILFPFIPFYSSDSNPLYVTAVKKHSYMAFSKKCHELLLGQFQTYGREADLYQSGSFAVALAALSLPLKYKYDGPPTSTRDPVPLWKVSLEAFSSILLLSLSALSKISSGFIFIILDVDRNRLDEAYCGIIGAFDCYLLSKSVCPFPPTSENFIKDEQLDLTIISLLEKEVLPFFGNPNIHRKYCEDSIKILVKLASQEYNENVIELGLKGSVQVQASTSRLFSPGTTPGETPLYPATIVADPDTLDIGPNQLTPQRERQGLVCLDTLFVICSDASEATPTNLNLASIALPILLEKCKSIFEKYISERPISNRLPMPRSRNQEMIVLLKGLLNMKVRVSKTEYSSVADEIAAKNFLLNSSLAHLFVLYPLICQLLGTISGHAALSQSSGDGQARISDEADMAVLLLACLEKVGTIWK